MNTKSKNKRYALISTYNKSKLDLLCKYFKKNKICIISTGSTSAYIKGKGYECISLKDLTKFKEILDGRVKTLHPKLHASLLYKRSNKNHVKTFKSLSFPIIDFVIVNLYPFEKIIKKNNNLSECIEMIDIGGPALIRSAAKNFNDVTCICDLNDYNKLINNLKLNNGETSFEFRKKMAQKVYKITSIYDMNVHNWFTNFSKFSKNEIKNKKSLRYGENPNQKASFIYIKNKQNIYNNTI